MFKWLKWLKRLVWQKERIMINQDLTDITRGLQHAAATTNSLVAEQYIRILAQYFETLPDGTLQAKMVRVQISEEYYAMVPLVSMVAPSGLALDRMRVELSLKVEQAEEKRASILDMRHGHADDPAPGDVTRSAFAVSMSPRSKGAKRRPSDQVDIVMEFVARETPESVMRVIETYTNLIQPLKMPEDGSTPPGKVINLKTGAGMDTAQAAAAQQPPQPPVQP
jgi:hypothetical protein